MAITVEGGRICTNGQDDNYAPVVSINFSTANRDATGRVPNGSIGDMILDRIPAKHNFVKGERLHYSDGNDHNLSSFTVESATGPTKYKISVISVA